MMKHDNKFRERFWIGLIFFVTSAFFWARFPFQHKALFYDTFFKNFFPDAVLFKSSLLSGEWPFWNPYMYSGIPFLANTEPSVFYPATLLQLIFSYPMAALVTTWAHAFLAGIFMFVLAKKFGLTQWGALLSGLLYAFNGYYVNHYAYTHIYQGYAWFPLVVWAFRKSLDPEKIFFLIFAAFGLAFQILSGHPQFVFYSCLILSAYAVWWSQQAALVGSRKIKPFLILFSIILLAILLSAIQLVPTLFFAAESPRRLGSGYAWSTIYSLNPRELARMLVFPLWNRYWLPVSGDPNVVGFYVGWTVCFLSIMAVLRKKLLNNAHVTVLILISATGMFLALGKYQPLYPLMYKFLFPFKIFRFPAQALYMACFGISLLAGYGLESFSVSRKMKATIIFICLLDLWVFSFKAVKTIDPIFYETKPKFLQQLQAKDPLARFFLTPKTRAVSWRKGKTELDTAVQFIDTLYPNMGMAYGLYDADGLQELRYAKYEDVLNEISRNPISPWLNVLGIRYVFSFWNNLPAHFEVVQSSPFFIFENKKAFPKAYLVPHALSLSLDETIPYVRAHPAHNFFDTVIINTLFKEQIFKSSDKLTSDVYIRDYKPNKITIEVKSNMPAWLVLSDGYDHGWSAKINGEKVPVFRANAIFRAVHVPSENSLIEFSYRPKYFDVGKWISLAVVFMSAFFLLFYTVNKNWNLKKKSQTQ